MGKGTRGAREAPEETGGVAGRVGGRRGRRPEAAAESGPPGGFFAAGRRPGRLLRASGGVLGEVLYVLASMGRSATQARGWQPDGVTGTPAFVASRFIALGRCCVSYTMKTGPPTSKKSATCSLHRNGLEPNPRHLWGLSGV